VAENTDIEKIKKVVGDTISAGLVPVLSFDNKNFELKPDSDQELEKAVSW